MNAKRNAGAVERRVRLHGLQPCRSVHEAKLTRLAV